MADPLAILVTPVEPVDPDPTFAAQLRERLRQSLDLPEGVTVSGIHELSDQHAGDGLDEASAEPARHGDVTYASWWTPDADRAARFYAAVLGWEYSAPRPNGGRMVTNVARPLGLFGVGTGTSTLFCCYLVDDLDASVERVRALGGTISGPADTEHGRIADGVDPLGTQLALAQAGQDSVRPTERGTNAGDLVYLTFETPDSQATRRFYGGLLGWRFTPGQVEDGWQCEGAYPMTGIWGGAVAPVIVPMWQCGDIEATVARVRSAGGRVLTPPAQQGYGVSAECADDQDGRFYLLGG